MHLFIFYIFIFQTWLENHGKSFYGFVDGQWLNKDKIEKDIKANIECHKICNNFSGKHLCNVYTSIDEKLLNWTAGNSKVSFSHQIAACEMPISKILLK